MQVIYLQPDAPPKPALGAPCNGCGVCCLAEPCPLGVLLSARRAGACNALRWIESERRYRCGAITHPQEVLSEAMQRTPLPGAVQRGLTRLLAARLPRWALRWVAAGQGCDATLEAVLPTPTPTPTPTSDLPSAQAAPPGHGAQQR